MQHYTGSSGFYVFKKIRIIASVLSLVFALSLTGCASGESVYDKAMEYKATDEEIKALSEGKLRYEMEYDRSDFDSAGEWFRYMVSSYVSYGTRYIRQYSIYIIVISLAIGILMFTTARKSIQIRKTGLLIFIIGIPLFVLLAVYGSAILADSF